MAYLNVDMDYFDHPKTKRLVALLGPGAAEYPIRLWAYCGKYYCKDGVIRGHSDIEIEALLSWDKKTGELLQAMAKVGFIIRRKNSVQVHDWKSTQGHIYAIKKRNKRIARKRFKNIYESV